MGDKIKVLFVVMDFYQAGAQRFMYEVDSALDKTKFEVHILSNWSLNVSKDFSDYYYKKHIELGSRIYFLKDILGKDPLNFRILNKLSNNSISRRVLPGFVKNKIESALQNNNIKVERFNKFLEQFDVINWVGEYLVAILNPLINKAVFNKSVIHIMNGKFQGRDDYAKFPKDVHYIFASGFDEEKQIKYEFSEIPNYRHVIFPLFLNIYNNVNKWKFKSDKRNKKIGIFTRLHPMKPLDPFMYAFHLLLEQLPDTELHIFGAGDPVESGMLRYVKHLGMEDKVFFRGHAEDLVKTAISEDLDLVWFQGYRNRPGGYAGFDICQIGIPQVFWEFASTVGDSNTEDNIYPIYKNLRSFVKKSIDVLTDGEAAMQLSNIQFNDVVEKRDMKKNISILENLFREFAGS